jgi:hypothetical protein
MPATLVRSLAHSLTLTAFGLLALLTSSELLTTHSQLLIVQIWLKKEDNGRGAAAEQIFPNCCIGSCGWFG